MKHGEISKKVMIFNYLQSIKYNGSAPERKLEQGSIHWYKSLPAETG